MQAQNSKKSEGSSISRARLALSTACTECHKRKQKCDQKQPCRHCARRFPQPACIYPAKRQISIPREISKELEPVDAHQHGFSLITDLDISSSNGNSNHALQEEIAWNVGPGPIQNPNRNYSSIIPRDAPNDWDTESYQRLLNTMVSRISDVVVSDHLPLISSSVNRGEMSAEPHGVNEYIGRSFRRPDWNAETLGTPSTFSISSVDPLHFLGITPTVQKAQLLRAFVAILTKYTVSLDGCPSPNYYNDHWVPWSIKSPLLAYLGIFTAACIQSEARKVPPNTSAVVLGFKLKSISLLNEMLRSKENATSNEAISAVSILVANEWYWSNFENVQAHLKGLREMVRLRGGIGLLEMHEFLKKMILVVDYNIACSYDCELSFPHNVAILPQHSPRVMTPLLSSRDSFAANAEDLGISKETAMILDDMRFLTLATIKQVERSTTDQEIAKLRMTASWTRDRIFVLPDGNDLSSPLAKDYIYKSCRISALIYCRAIIDHIPLSRACNLKDLNQLWANMWRITLTCWKRIPGIFYRILLSAGQAAQEMPHGRFLKSMLKAVSQYMALDYWEVVDGASMAFVRLQRWLRNARVVDEEIVAGEIGTMEFMHIYRE